MADFLEKASESPIRKYTPAGGDVDSVIEFLVVFQQGSRDINMQDVHAFLSPPKGVYRLRDHNKLFCPDLDDGDDIFDKRGIDREGCIVITRPDQHVASVLPLDGYDALAKFFDGTMIPQNK